MPPLTIVPRSDWGALPPQKEIADLPKPVLKVLMTKTRTLPCNNDEECKFHIRKMQAFHMGKGFEDIAYNFIITPDAKVYEGRGWYKVAPTPVERPEFKDAALVIAHIGDYPATDEIYRWQVRSTMAIIDYGILNNIVDFEVRMAEMYPFVCNEGFELEDPNHKFPIVDVTDKPE
ncbi:peptidoglycan-recognition protein SB2-like isoform X1 [Macrosteles quadrilineatus]|uniref:peptidoglycan-recognition protein SB2-like isoform X1 n=1 Tax=Macrosteles quadrilineatus TaxID=74068 RepID=UPI0023E24C29|nr:peptidoglycan-recognition protein SB2-like isoform X1 [Macrosteles quadrilineatus]XP_054264834.1 peptidoglycan-recognition protein SB2-like isoform X1 [Macrosteles quadrilineatus]